MAGNESELMPRVFNVEGDNNEFDLDIPPLSGQEYLKRVQLEARSVPAVVVAEIDASLLKDKQTVGAKHSGILPAPQGYASSQVWQNYQTANFSGVRQQLVKYKSRIKKDHIKRATRLPLKEDVESWCRLCFGRYQSCKTDHGGASVEAGHEHGTPPLLSIIAHMDQHTVMEVLEYHLNWFEATGFTPEQGRWFYALLSCVEKPLVPEASFLLRGLARNCANLRASLTSTADPLLSHLNLLICLVVKYFDQRDLENIG